MAELYNNRGLVWRDKADYERALSDFGEAIIRNPNYSLPYINRGEIWYLKKDIAKALADFNKALAITPNPIAYAYRGRAWLALDDRERAFADFKEALRVSPNDISALEGRGEAYEQSGDLDKARADYERALSIGRDKNPPSDWPAQARARERLEALKQQEAKVAAEKGAAREEGSQSRRRRKKRKGAAQRKRRSRRKKRGASRKRKSQPKRRGASRKPKSQPKRRGASRKRKSRPKKRGGRRKPRSRPKRRGARRKQSRGRKGAARAGSEVAAKGAAEQEVKVAAEKARREQEAKVAAEKARQEQEAKVAAEKARREQEAKVAAEKARREQEAKVAAEKARREQEAKVAAEKARREEEAKAAAEKARREQEASAELERARQQEGKRVALVIGNSNYSLGPLENPKNDADDVTAALQRLHFEVAERKDLTIRDFDKAIDTFEAKAQDADVALFFFSGHGVQIDKRGYLAPIDVNTESESIALRSLEPIQEVVSRIEHSAKVSVIVIDACRDSPLQERLRRIAVEKNRGLVPPKGLPPVSIVGSNTLIVYATVPGETASDGVGRNSPFAAALLRHIETPGLEIEQMFKHVTADVLTATGGKQQPERLSRLQNELVLLPRNVRREDTSAAIR